MNQFQDRCRSRIWHHGSVSGYRNWQYPNLFALQLSYRCLGAPGFVSFPIFGLPINRCLKIQTRTINEKTFWIFSKWITFSWRSSFDQICIHGFEELKLPSKYLYHTMWTMNAWNFPHIYEWRLELSTLNFLLKFDCLL